MLAGCRLLIHVQLREHGLYSPFFDWFGTKWSSIMVSGSVGEWGMPSVVVDSTGQYGD